MNPRYEGRPFLRLLECYVLWALGVLSEEEQGKLEDLTPKLQGTFKRDGTWQEIVAAEMRLPPDCAEAIVRNWAENRSRAVEQGVQLLPQQFAESLADVWWT